MATNDDIMAAVLNLDRVESRPSRFGTWFIFNRSPLARKIILFNLIALGILVSGILYLNQAQESQVDLRGSVVARQAEMISAAIHSHDENPAYADLASDGFRAFFESLVGHSNAIVQIYGSSGEAELIYAPSADTKITANIESDAFTGTLQRLWTALSASGGNGTPEENRQDLQSKFNQLASTAMTANARTKNEVLSVGGEIYVAVALPIFSENGVSGAILISTHRGEVDSIIRGAREQILQMFLLATLSSIILSMVLANSIARPLRRLSAAAQNAHNEAGGKTNLARVNIPDLSARPDEIGDLSRSMRNMTDALLEKIDENKSFAADVAHEIKNPLTSLRSAVETLGYVRDDESKEALLGVIQSDVDRLDRLVTDISNASRLEGELVRDTWENIDICALLQAMADNFRHRGRYPNVNISVEIEVQNCQIRGLRTRLEQVFTNLISNALSFVPEDGVVLISAHETASDCLVIEVSDNGPGIPAENLEDIFSRFYSERPEEQFGEHSGLGLAITRQIIEAHSGAITAQNNEAGGALFTVKLLR